jgi:hypothetical protein
MTKCTPSCDAEMAVLVRALERTHRRLQHEVVAPTYEQREATCLAAKVADIIQEEIGSLYANPSPAAAALLAQGERLKAVEGEIDALDDMGERLSVVEEALAIKVLIRKHVTRLNRALSGRNEAYAALAPGEEKDVSA